MSTIILRYSILTANGSLIHQKDSFPTMLSARINSWILSFKKDVYRPSILIRKES